MSLLSKALGGLARNAGIKAISALLGENGSLITISGDGIQIPLPVDPASFEIQVTQKNTVIEVINIGELNMLGKTGLKTIAWSGLLPAQDYSFNNAGASTDPYSIIDSLNSLRTAGKHAHVSVSAALDMDATIESLRWGEQDGSGDVYYSIELKEYVDPAPSSGLLDKVTGLKKSNMSFLQRAGLNAARNMLKGQSPLRAVTGAVAASGLTPKQQGYLKVFETVSKKGGLKAGDIVSVGSQYIKINGKDVANVFKHKKVTEVPKNTSGKDGTSV